MQNYRFYFHGADGHFVRAENIRAADDEAALAKAGATEHAHGIEIWCGERKVGLVQPEGEGASAD